MLFNIPLITGIGCVVGLAWLIDAMPLAGPWKAFLSLPTLAGLVWVVWQYA